MMNKSDFTDAQSDREMLKKDFGSYDIWGNIVQLNCLLNT
jgi:hypothetical protein